jgi:outer membrane protein assembly factor BamB
VYAEPLVYQGVVIVATENDSVYALNATSGAAVWRRALGAPMPGSALPCGDISPSGITGTPVIDASTGTVYVVAFESPGAHYLVALSLSDGSVRFSQPADPVGANPLVEQQRSALSLGNGRVYIPYGGLFGDCGDYHGWMVGIQTDGNGPVVSYEVPSSREAGIWAPSGAAIDASGEIFVATGNSASTTSFDFGDAVIKLSPALAEVSYFAPSEWSSLNQGDTDLGSTGPVLLANGDVFQVGKEGVGYLLNAGNLGGIGGQSYAGQVCSSAYGGDATAGSLVFVPCSDGLVALSTTASSFSVLWRTASYPAGPPVVTGGVVWAMDTTDGTLRGYDTQTGAVLFQFHTGGVTRFTTPSVGDGRLFVAAEDEVYSFSLDG